MGIRQPSGRDVERFDAAVESAIRQALPEALPDYRFTFYRRHDGELEIRANHRRSGSHRNQYAVTWKVHPNT